MSQCSNKRQDTCCPAAGNEGATEPQGRRPDSAAPHLEQQVLAPDRQPQQAVEEASVAEGREGALCGMRSGHAWPWLAGWRSSCQAMELL